jgi:hypothetical protein
MAVSFPLSELSLRSAHRSLVHRTVLGAHELEHGADWIAGASRLLALSTRLLPSMPGGGDGPANRRSRGLRFRVVPAAADESASDRVTVASSRQGRTV